MSAAEFGRVAAKQYKPDDQRSHKIVAASRSSESGHLHTRTQVAHPNRVQKSNFVRLTRRRINNRCQLRGIFLSAFKDRTGLSCAQSMAVQIVEKYVVLNYIFLTQ